MDTFQKIKTLIHPYRPETTKQWIIAACIGTAVSSTVVMTTFCIRAKVLSKRQRKPLPSEEELNGIDGSYFKRPSDGKLMEYFSLNGGDGKDAVVIFHGSMGTGYCWSHWRSEQILPMLEKKNTMLICPSMPGHGASEPMRLKNPKQVLDNVAKDMTALLEKLNVKKVHVGGISYGVEPAFYFAQTLLQSTKNVKVSTVSSLCGAPWSTKTFDFTADQSRGFWLNLFSEIFKKQTLLEFAAIYILDPMMSGMSSAGDDGMKQSLGEDAYERLKDVVPVLTKDLLRGYEYFYDGLGIAPTLNSCQRVNDVNTDYSYFESIGGLRVNFHYGDNDTDVTPTARKYIMDKIPKGKLFPYHGGHTEVPLVEAIKQMLAL